jgi:3-hydroxyisobutyrate dehydrogenase
MDTSLKIGFVGLGQMGRPMAENLLKAGFSVVVHNRSRMVIAELVELGATEADSAAEVAAASDVFCTCLMLPEQVDEVYCGAKGALTQSRDGKILIDFSTVEPATSRAIGAKAVACGAQFLDAPISGGPRGAANATLSIMVGGDPTAFARARPILERLGKKIFHLGPVGTGTTAKICNQILTGVTHVLVAEAMVLGTKAGADPRTLYEVLRVSSGQSNSLERAVPNFILPGIFDPAFTVTGITKDLECALRTAKSLGVRLLLAPVAQQCYVEAAGLGHGQKDVASVILPMEAIAGTQVRDRPAESTGAEPAITAKNR